MARSTSVIRPAPFDRELAKRAKHLTTTARVVHRWNYTHDQIGYNYRLPNLNAALGCAQLERLPEFLLAKRHLYKRYKQAFDSVTGMDLVCEPDGCCSNYWLQALLLDESEQDGRDLILSATNEAGYMTRPVWTLLNQLEPYKACQSMPLPVAESLARRLINLPSSPGLMLGKAD